MKQHDLSYWEALAERYFQAETSEREEAELREFLCSSQAQDSRFDVIRATMSLLHVCRQASPKKGVNYADEGIPSPWKRVLPYGLAQAAGERLRIIAVAACLCAAAFLGWYQYQQYNISSVRIAGEDVEADASQLMQQQMAEVLNPVNP